MAAARSEGRGKLYKEGVKAFSSTRLHEHRGADEPTNHLRKSTELLLFASPSRDLRELD